MGYDAIVIGAGLSGLSAASLLAKRGLKVAVVEQGNSPGGACGIFKRKEAVFDQGTAMLYGFGEHGFNAYRFLFNCLEEPFDVIRHDPLYVIHYNGKKIHCWLDVDRFIKELSEMFPNEEENIHRFYKDMQKLYSHVISESPDYTTLDEINTKDVINNVLKHPLSYLKFLSYSNISGEKLLRNYFTDPEIFRFFDKWISAYCHATVKEVPAILASIMFIDNHEGGVYHPAGSTLFLPGKLEKVIEEHGGEMCYDSRVEKILFDKEKPVGVLLENGEKLFADQIVYSGTVWNLYEKLLPRQMVMDEERDWVKEQVPAYPSVVLYALVDSAVIPKDTCPIEMLTTNSDAVEESELTVYIRSIDDHTLCREDQHTVMAIGPSLRQWENESEERYEEQKQEEMQRMIEILSHRFPHFEAGILYCELGTPRTIERYTMKNGGATAGPKQMLGQHMLMRQSIRTRWESLFCCGESTTMGTGASMVTTSGIAAANAVLKKRGLKPYVWQPDMKNYVRVMNPPVSSEWLSKLYSPKDVAIMAMAGRCFYCSRPSCCNKRILDIPGIMRRVSCGNFDGAKRVIRKAIREARVPLTERFLAICERNCVQNQNQDMTDEKLKSMVHIEDGVRSGAVEIKKIFQYIRKNC